MTWLKQAGIDIVSAIGKVAPFLPMLSLVIPQAAPALTKISDTLTKFATAVTTTEAASAALATPNPGPVKLQQALPLFGQAVEQWLAAAGLTVQDQTLYDKAVQEFTQGTVDMLNACKPQPVQAVAA